MGRDISIRARVNGDEVRCLVPARQSLGDFIRETLRLTGTHLGCEHGVCGACSVRIGGDVVRSCLCLAAQIDGKVVETIEGASDSGALDALQAAFTQFNAAQCGFCTPGMLLTAHELISQGGDPDRKQIRDYISGNFCRCTGYHAIVDAIESVVRARRAAGAGDA